MECDIISLEACLHLHILSIILFIQMGDTPAKAFDYILNSLLQQLGVWEFIHKLFKNKISVLYLRMNLV